MERKAISKKIRFEVFKRDSFTCQYCGAKSPDVVLHVDHISPVSAGGENDILNLVTSCQPCNLGKSDRALDDGSVVARQRDQLEELQDRREQLDMMMAWKRGLLDLDEQAVDHIAEAWGRFVPGYHLNERGRIKVRRLVRKYGLEKVLDAAKEASNQYLELTEDPPRATNESAQKIFNYIEKIIRVREDMKDKPWLRDLFYVRAIVKNNFGLNWRDDQLCRDLLEDAFRAGHGREELRSIAVRARDFSEWLDAMAEILPRRKG